MTTSASFDPAPLLTALDSLLPSVRPLSLHEPCFVGHEWDYVKECLDTGWVSSVGFYVDRFERDLADRLGVAHVVAVVNGTAALHMALMLAGVRPGDEAIIPALTFAATANAVVHCGAIPHLVDSARDSLGLDPARLDEHLRSTADLRGEACINRRTGRRIAAVVPMHVFGHPVDMDALAEVAARWGLPIVEDAAEALGSLYKGRPAGSFGRLAAISFNGNKIITTGGGGAIATNDPELARHAKHLTTTAKVPHPWAFVHDEVGYNYRLPNLNAALGCAQLEQLDAFIAAKRALAERYRAALAGVPGVDMVDEPAYGRSIHWLNALLVPNAAARDAVLRATHERKILTRPAWTLMHRLAIYAECPRAELPVAEELESRLICLPSSVSLAKAMEGMRS